MTGLLRPVTALLIATAVLLLGNGLLAVLLPLRANLEGFSPLEIGTMGSAHYIGLVAGCILGPVVIGRVGHIRAFAAFTATVTVTPLLLAMWLDPVSWSALRIVNGLCFAGLFMAIESWLTGASSIETRGRVLAVYTILNLTVVTAGMQMLGLADPRGFQLFSLDAVFYSLAAVPVALTTTPAPASPRRARLRLGWLMAVSPAAVLGCFFTGIANSAFWTLAPIYAKDAGLSVPQVASFLTVAILAGAATQWPVGWLADRVGRRRLLTITATSAALAGIALYLADNQGAPTIFALAALYGAAAFPIYPLCVAHANDLVAKKRAVEVSSGLLLTFSLGAVVGPLTASALISWEGHGALFLNSAAAHILIAVATVVRRRIRPTPPAERSEGFIAVPRTTQAVFGLDPRAAPARPRWILRRRAPRLRSKPGT